MTIIDLQKELFSITRALEDAAIPYALCGGLAVVIHGYPRLTRDIDILIRQEDLDRARQVVEEISFDVPSGLLPFDVGTPYERQIFRVGKVEGTDLLTLDFIVVPSFLEQVWAARETHEVAGHILRVVSRDGLKTMKRIAGRPQDLADLAQLEDEDENEVDDA